MKSSTLGWVRLALAIPAALLVTLLVQMAATRVFGAMLMHPGERLANGLVLVEGVNMTKIVSSPFMAAALFWTLYLVAPKHRRSSVAVAALVVIGLWGGLIISGLSCPGPEFTVGCSESAWRCGSAESCLTGSRIGTARRCSQLPDVKREAEVRGNEASHHNVSDAFALTDEQRSFVKESAAKFATEGMFATTQSRETSRDSAPDEADPGEGDESVRTGPHQENLRRQTAVLRLGSCEERPEL